ncbi:asparagine synthase-related protein [Azospirillum sp. SYSU D00513]|uniref:asparagine synthase-related protein n=1 Tax=Azospirillum sp. SYSU D00513 TaxID=2812561 RepID=UPI001A964E7C|nr:asparagine synthase-related protein [Azospirillum sp. SYSU D00513]
MFAGTFLRRPGPAADPPAHDALIGVLDPYGNADRHGVWAEAPFLLAHALRFNTPESEHEETPYRCPESGLVIAAWARLDNREDLARALGTGRPLDELTDPQLILMAWRRWGTGCVARLLGDFAFAIADPGARTLFLARDPLGVKPLYYRLDERQLRFATTAALFAAGGPWPAEPDPDWMARYLMGLSAHPTLSAYREVRKLAPGHWLLVAPDRTETERWFHWRDDPPPARRREERWVEAYRAVLEEAIRCRLRSGYPLGTENSGGIDSATITAYLARFLGEPGERLHGFGFAMSEQEPAFILETSRALGIVHNHIITAPVEAGDAYIERGLRVLGYPEEHGNATGHIPFYRECGLHGIRTLFSGFGGDEVVTNPGHHLRQEMLDGGDYAGLWNILPGDPLRRSLRLAKAVALRRRRPEYNPRSRDAWLKRWHQRALRDEVATELDLFRDYMDSARYDAPFRRINDFILKHHLHDMQVTARLESCTLLAASHGIDYRWPLWDVRLVQQYLSTPSIEKAGPLGIGRYLHRRAIDGVVPGRVAWKPSKDMGTSRLHETLKTTGLARMAGQAHRQQAHLHPALEALIDQDRWRGQIERAAKGSADGEFAFMFRRNTRAIRWLNAWLHGGPVG